MTTTGIGARLKEARVKKGISLDEAQKKTKIHVNILAAIEADSCAHISPIYLKGFLKIYCRFLQVDPSEIIPDYKAPQSASKLMARNEDSEPLRVGATKVDFSFLKPWLSPRFLLSVAGVVVACILVFSVGKLLSQRKVHPPVSAPVVKAVVVKPVVKKSKVAVVKPVEDAPKAVVSPTLVRLVLRAKSDCYVTVKADSHTVFQGLLKKLRAETWSAKEKIELSVGDAGAVELEVNGRPIPSLGRKKQQLKNIVITKEGLSVS